MFLTKENLLLTAHADHIRTNDLIADRAGAQIAEVLGLKRDKQHKDRWLTSWGNKTNAGLARSVLVMIEDLKYTDKEADKPLTSKEILECQPFQ